jgi:cbb3-type cytochrome oxidase maturation protein
VTVGVFLLIFGLVGLSGSALIAFYWSAKHGQLRELEKGAKVIFDETEPIGKATDSFPGSRVTRASARPRSGHGPLVRAEARVTTAPPSVGRLAQPPAPAPKAFGVQPGALQSPETKQKENRQNR